MNAKPRIFAFAGSARKESVNRKLLVQVVEALRREGAEVDLVDLKEHPMPLYDGDLEEEQGIPEVVHGLRRRMKEAQGLLIATPEYNSGYTPLLKNTIDWVSRPAGEDPALAGFTGKVAALVAASPSQYGGLRSLAALRTLLENLGVRVVPGQVALAKAYEKFDEEGHLLDAEEREAVARLARELMEALTPVTA